MMIIAIVLRVFFLWFAISFALGLCWAIACLVAPRVKRRRAVSARTKAERPIAGRPVGRIVRFSPKPDEGAQEDPLVDDLGSPVIPLPRRFAPHQRPVREVTGRLKAASRSENEQVS